MPPTPEKSPRVFIPQEPRYKDQATGRYKKVNMLSLLDWGSPEVLLEGRDDVPAPMMLNGASVIRLIKQRVSGYRDQDFIVAAGDPAAIGATCAVAALANRGRFTLLVWDRQEQKYYPVKVNLLEET